MNISQNQNLYPQSHLVEADVCDQKPRWRKFVARNVEAAGCVRQRPGAAFSHAVLIRTWVMLVDRSWYMSAPLWVSSAVHAAHMKGGSSQIISQPACNAVTHLIITSGCSCSHQRSGGTGGSVTGQLSPVWVFLPLTSFCLPIWWSLSSQCCPGVHACVITMLIIYSKDINNSILQ